MSSNLLKDTQLGNGKAKKDHQVSQITWLTTQKRLSAYTFRLFIWIPFDTWVADPEILFEFLPISPALNMYSSFGFWIHSFLFFPLITHVLLFQPFIVSLELLLPASYITPIIPTGNWDILSDKRIISLLCKFAFTKNDEDIF